MDVVVIHDSRILLLVYILVALLSPISEPACAQASGVQKQRARLPLVEQLDNGQPQTIVVYGTSLTAGGAWVGQLSSHLDARVLSKQPDAVSIEFAMKDAFTEYPAGDIDEGITVQQARANLEQMIARIQQHHAGSQIILQTMNPSWDAPNGNHSGTKRPHLPEHYHMYRDVADEQGLLLVDNNKVWLALQANQPGEFAHRVADGAHPDATGYARLVTPALLYGLGVDNQLVLVVDVQSGQAVLHNQSDTPLEIIGYTIASPVAALSTSWNRLADQQLDGWQEANPSAHNLSELNPTGSQKMASDARFDLGTAWNPTGALDVNFDYQTSDGMSHAGLVVYTTGVEDLLRVAGDYNGDGVVNLADYTVWRNTLGASVRTGTSADGNCSGVIDTGDYQTWKASFGASQPGLAASGVAESHSVPEPASLVPACMALAAVTLGPLLSIPRRPVRSSN